MQEVGNCTLPADTESFPELGLRQTTIRTSLPNFLQEFSFKLLYGF